MSVELNKHGVNANIKATILSDEEMLKIGFFNYQDTWCFLRNYVEKSRVSSQYDWVVSFNVTIPKDGSDISIDVLDEAFLQPYDYQAMLEEDPKFKYALIIQKFVEKHMKDLQDAGVLSGHKYGEYI